MVIHTRALMKRTLYTCDETIDDIDDGYRSAKCMRTEDDRTADNDEDVRALVCV